MGRLRALGIAVLAAALIATGLVVVPAAPAAAVARELAVQQILADTNALRAQLGLQPLARNASLDSVAQAWTQRMADANKLSHNPSVGSQIPSGWTRWGENVAAGYTYRSVVNGWRGSSGHYSNMVDPLFTDIGIGYVERNGSTFFTQDFARYSRPGPPAPVPSPTPTSAPIPKVEGNRLIDTRTGATWVPHGVNFPGFEYACQQGWGYSQGGATDAAAVAMRSWGIDAVRIPLNEQCWLGVEGNPRYGSVSGYRAAVRAWVDVLNARGIVAILDLHWSAPPGSQADGQRAMTGTRSVLFWQSVAAAFSKTPAVMFDVFNEPYSRGSFSLSWSCWKNGGCWAPIENDVTSVGGQTFQVVGVQALVTTIRKAGAKQPIMLAGLDYANDLRGWLANRPSDSQLVAAWHNYPAQRCRTVACWNAEIAPVAAVVPVFAGEFGQTDGGSSHFTTFLPWADAHGIGYAPWAWWVVEPAESPSASLYALIRNTTDFAPKPPAGTAYAAHLATLPPPVEPPVPEAPSRPGSGPGAGSGGPVGPPVVDERPRPPVGEPRVDERPQAAKSGTVNASSAPDPLAPVLKVGLAVEHQLKSLV